MVFSNTLIAWYLQNKRDLPWRNTKDPYQIWLSEIMLQQTRVAQATPYYFAFLSAFPTVRDLASADENQILKLWQGLGYYSRARNMHNTAKIVSSEHNGAFPKNYQSLLKLKGIGPYSAAAIASFAFNEPIAVVDGNVYRVLARVFGLEDDIAKPKSRKIFFALAQSLLDEKRPDLFNQAIMEFGATRCTPKNPACNDCPLESKCFARANRCIERLPLKSKATKTKNRFFNYFVATNEARETLMQKRTSNDIWLKLYEFPLHESTQVLSFDEASEIATSLFPKGQVIAVSEFPKQIKHKLTHQTITLAFWNVTLSGFLPDATPIDRITDYPMPIAIHNFVVSEISPQEK